MRTTLNIDDELLNSAKHRALEENVSLVRVIESALRETLSKPRVKRGTIRLITTSGSGVKPGVGLDNGRLLLDIMDDQS